MVHWSEGRPREHPRDNFPPRDAASVRAFVAVRMNHQVEGTVAAMIEELRREHDGVSWVARANLHVTLKFLGTAVEAHRLERLTAALHELAARTAPFTIVAEGLGAFPDFEHPRAIWTGLHSVELGALASRVETTAVECGFERDDHRWNGHLTIGRVREASRLGDLRAAIRASSGRRFGTSEIESITLYRSHPGAESSRYEALATLLFHRPGQPA